MSAPKYILTGSLLLFGLIGVMSLAKKKETPVVIEEERPLVFEEAIEEVVLPPVEVEDKVPLLFTTGPSKLPIVETVTYSSRVPWLKGRPAWITDYAAHYQTSRHFIARSLNRRPDYYTQKVASGNQFNVLKEGVSFLLDIDLQSHTMHFYYVNGTEKGLLKVYTVGVGRRDAHSPSGFLTPQGTFKLEDKVAIYKPGIMGYFQEQEVEMIQVFGTRWIPFDVQGYGIHGVPWIRTTGGELTEDRSGVGAASSDGCIRLTQEDMEELFSIVITRPTTVEIK